MFDSNNTSGANVGGGLQNTENKKMNKNYNYAKMNTFGVRRGDQGGDNSSQNIS